MPPLVKIELQMYCGNCKLISWVYKKWIFVMTAPAGVISLRFWQSWRVIPIIALLVQSTIKVEDMVL